MRKLLVLFLLVLMSGCAKDDRAKQGSNLLNVMTQTAKKEYEEAPTPPDKDVVATEYFKEAPKFTQALDDYMHDRPPTTIDVPVPVPAPAKAAEPEATPKCKSSG
jgi:hypothetical protein